MRRVTRPGGVLSTLAVLAAMTVTGCGQDPFGPPPRVATHGYRAHVTVKEGGKKTSFQLAVRGDDRRREPEAGTPGPIVIWKGKERRVYELDPAKKTVSERAFASLDEVLPGHPLTPGFSDRVEAARRGIQEYHRESDTVFAGHACWIWRFEDKPGDEASPSTSYWVAPDLDSLVVLVDREAAPKPDGSRDLVRSELTDVRVGAKPELFQVPGGYAKK